jgi:uncharacterized protein YjgD (DUF1641 family)
MKTLSIAISDLEYAKFGITSTALSFSEFVDMVSKEIMKENLQAVTDMANTYGLSSMTMDDITVEVQSARRTVAASQNAENNN